MIAYLETSALLKLLLAETGTVEVGRIWESASRCVTSAITYAESRAALAAATRRGRINKTDLAGRKLDLERRLAQMFVIDVSTDVVLEAGDIAEAHSLRTLDAIHAATALSVAAEETITVTFDRELARALEEIGVRTGPAL